MPTPIVIGFGTTNPHKLQESQACLMELLPSVQVIGISPQSPVEETGATFEENALIKLQALLETPIPENITHLMTEDAGLIIEALDGYTHLSPFPGLRSDRWLTPAVQQALLGEIIPELALTYTHKNQALLKLMATQQNRKAAYLAAISCWSKAQSQIMTVVGSVDLEVAQNPKGLNGFGYDPIMQPTDIPGDRVMAELSPEEKNKISHRYKALVQLIPFIAASYS